MARAPESLDGEHFDVVIIGAGMAGLAAGIRLALADKRVIILERHNVSGGLNSFYSIEGRKYDVGLHAMTNFVPPGTKGTPLIKLLRQLRIDRAALDLCEQNGSRIVFPEHSLRFTNDFSLFEAEVAAAFPGQIDGFRRLAADIRELDAFNLGSRPASAREAVRRFISDSTLEDMLFCPVMYYGSPEAHDMDYGQFAIMFRSLFFEGFARPFEGVRTVIRALHDKYRSLGGLRKMKAGVARIETERGHASGVLLENGERLTADRIISTAGVVETLRMCDDQPEDAEAANIGRLSFVETITVLNEEPKALGWDDTILFFNTAERFAYAPPADGALVDPRSGVICFPNNYQYGDGRKLDEGFLRITALANHDEWCGLGEDAYQAAKAHWYDELLRTVGTVLPQPTKDLSACTVAHDMFTPRTIRKYTGHLGGAVYGATHKVKDGTTHLDNLFLAGTDQGFLGIVGAMLSGISMANLHVLQGR